MVNALLDIWRGLPIDVCRLLEREVEACAGRYQAGGPVSLFEHEGFLHDLQQGWLAESPGLTRLFQPVVEVSTVKRTDSALPVLAGQHRLTSDYLQWRLTLAWRKFLGARAGDLSNFATRLDDLFLELRTSQKSGVSEVVVQVWVLLSLDLSLVKNERVIFKPEQKVRGALERLLAVVDLYARAMTEKPRPELFLRDLRRIYLDGAEPRSRLRPSREATDLSFTLAPRADLPAPVAAELKDSLQGARELIATAHTRADLWPQPVDYAALDQLTIQRAFRFASLVPEGKARFVPLKWLTSSVFAAFDKRYNNDRVRPMGKLSDLDPALVDRAVALLRERRPDVDPDQCVVEVILPYDSVFLDPGGRSEIKDAVAKIERGLQHKVLLVEDAGNFIVVRFITPSLEEALHEALYGAEEAAKYYWTLEMLDPDEIMKLRAMGLSPFSLMEGPTFLGDVGCEVDVIDWDTHERFHLAQMAQYRAKTRRFARGLFDLARRNRFMSGDILTRHLGELADMNGPDRNEENPLFFAYESLAMRYYAVWMEDGDTAEVSCQRLLELHRILQKYLHVLEHWQDIDPDLREEANHFYDGLWKLYNLVNVTWMTFWSYERLTLTHGAITRGAFMTKSLLNLAEELPVSSVVDIHSSLLSSPYFREFDAWFGVLRQFWGRVPRVHFGEMLSWAVIQKHFCGDQAYAALIEHLDLIYDWVTGWPDAVWLLITHLKTKPDFQGSRYLPQAMALGLRPHVKLSDAVRLGEALASD